MVSQKVPARGPEALTWFEDIRSEADEVSGVTKSLGGEEVGRTLGEAVLNREAGLRRLAIPLTNIQFALERHARLRIDNIQRIYMRPKSTSVVRDALGNIDEKLMQEYQAERTRLGSESSEFVQKFPEEPVTGAIFRNEYRNERLPFEKTPTGEIAPGNETWLEITPEEIRGEFDVKIRALSIIPVSKALEESRALETFNLIAQLPYPHIYKSSKTLLKKRGDDPDQWMQSEEEIIGKQSQASMAAQMGMGTEPVPAEAGPMVPPSQLEQPQGVGAQISKSLTF